MRARWFTGGSLATAAGSRGRCTSFTPKPRGRRLAARERTRERHVARAGDVLGIPSLGMRIVFRQTAADTDGALVEYDVIGRPRGFVVQAHVHPSQEERQEVLEGATGLSLGGASTSTARASRTRSRPARRTATTRPARPRATSGSSCGRRSLRGAPRAARAVDRDGQITSGGWLRPTATAHMIRDFEAEGRATKPPLALQRALAKTVLGAASLREGSTGEYVFVDEWDVGAPIATGLRRARRRPHVSALVAAGLRLRRDRRAARRRPVSQQHFKGRLPYHLHTTSVTRARAADHRRGRGRRRPSRPRSLDADRLGPGRRTSASTGRSSPTAAPAHADAGAAARVPLEPRLGDRPRDRGARAVRTRTMRRRRPTGLAEAPATSACRTAPRARSRRTPGRRRHVDRDVGAPVAQRHRQLAAEADRRSRSCRRRRARLWTYPSSTPTQTSIGISVDAARGDAASASAAGRPAARAPSGDRPWRGSACVSRRRSSRCRSR